MEAMGEIVNTPQIKDGLGMGLRFTDVSSEVLRVLGKFLDDNVE
jgi:hypothetical protein